SHLRPFQDRHRRRDGAARRAARQPVHRRGRVAARLLLFLALQRRPARPPPSAGRVGGRHPALPGDGARLAPPDDGGRGAARPAGRPSAALWVVPLALAASLRPVLKLIWSSDRLDAVLLPDTGFAGWFFQSAWVPQHLMSASCVVAAAMLMAALTQRGIL